MASLSSWWHLNVFPTICWIGFTALITKLFFALIMKYHACHVTSSLMSITWKFSLVSKWTNVLCDFLMQLHDWNKLDLYSQRIIYFRVNPLFSHSPTKPLSRPTKATLNQKSTSHHIKQRHNSPEIDYDDFHYPHSRSLQDKSTSSGYEGSNGASSLESGCNDLKNVEDSGVFVDQNPAYVKSIRVSLVPITPFQINQNELFQIAGRGLKPIKSVPSHLSSSSGGTLTTIPEGQVDLPQPIWPGIKS